MKKYKNRWDEEEIYKLISTPIDELCRDCKTHDNKNKKNKICSQLRYRYWFLKSFAVLRRLEAKYGVDKINAILISEGRLRPEEILHLTKETSPAHTISILSEIEKLKARSSYLQKMNKMLLREIETKNLIAETIENTIKALEPAPYIKPQIPRHSTVESAVAVFSCWHIGETVDPKQVNFLNEYNMDIFIKRLQYLTDKIIKFTTENMKSHRFDEIVLLFTGDMVSGIIHDELIETNNLTITEQAMIGAYVTAQAVREIASVFPKVRVLGVVGNHGRISSKKYYKNKQVTSWDYVFYYTLKLLLSKQSNIEFLLPQSAIAGIEIKGHKFLVFHGDQIRGWAGIPFYGLNRTTTRFMQIFSAQSEFYRYFVTSHYHTKASIQAGYGEQILNGSLKGTDEYSIASGLSNDPYQLLFGVHEKYGKTWELNINTKFASEEIKEVRYKTNYLNTDEV